MDFLLNIVQHVMPEENGHYDSASDKNAGKVFECQTGIKAFGGFILWATTYGRGGKEAKEKGLFENWLGKKMKFNKKETALDAKEFECLKEIICSQVLEHYSRKN